MSANVKIMASDSSFQSAMKENAKLLKNLKSEFGVANTQAKLFGSATEQLKTKQKELTSTMNIQNKTLKLQQDYSNKLKAELDKLKGGNTTLQQSIDKTEKSYKKSIEATGKNSEESKKLKEELSKLKEEFNKNENAISATEKKLDTNTTKVNTTKKAILEAKKALEDTEKAIKNMSLDKMANSFESASNKLNNIGSTLTNNVSLPLFGISAVAINTAMGFESQMSRVQGISQATADEFAKLEKQALDLGQSTSFSAGEVAMGMENLASAGFSTSEILESMPGLLDLAASSGEDLATSSEIASGTLRGFGLEASQASHVADVFSKSAAATNASVASTGEAMKYIAPVAKAMGLSIEEVTASIGIMADSNIKGSQAGTTLRSALTSLVKPSEAAAKTIESIGFKAFDSEGKMLPLNQVIGNLKESTKNMTDEQRQNAIATIFGQEAMSGLLTLIDAGPEKMQSLTEELKNSDGAAADMATTMKDNTKASIEEAFGALETSGIKVLKIVAPYIKNIADFIGDLAEKFNKLSPAQQQNILKWGAFAIALGPVLKILGGLTGGISKTLKFVANLDSNFNKLKTTTLAAGTNLKKVGTAMANGAKSAGTLALNLGKSALAFGKQAIQAGISVVKLVAQKVATIATTVATKAMSIAQAALNFVMALNPITLVIIAITALVAGIVYLWNTSDTFKNFCLDMWLKITDVFKKFDEFITNIFTTDWTKSFGAFGNILNAFFANCNNIWNGIKKIFSGVIDFIAGIFTGDWGRAWQGVTNIFGGIWDTIVSMCKAPLNICIGLINAAIDGINSIGFTVPEWFPGDLGGRRFKPSFSHINYLWQGGIVDEPTLIGNNTVAGDAFEGTGRQAEAVIPLDVMYRKIDEIISKKLQQNNQPIYITVNVANNLDKKGLGKVITTEVQKNITKGSNNYSQSRGYA